MTIPSCTAEVEVAHGMILTRPEGDRGLLLDQGRARRRKQYRALKERYRARLADRPAVESAPGVGEDLVEETGPLAEVRRRATTEALGEG